VGVLAVSKDRESATSGKLAARPKRIGKENLRASVDCPIHDHETTLRRMQGAELYAAKCLDVVQAVRALRAADQSPTCPELTALFRALDVLDGLPPQFGRAPRARVQPLSKEQVRAELVRVKFYDRAKALAEKHLVRSVDNLLNRSRLPRNCRARHELWLEMKDAGFSSPEIGAMFGRDHSTVLMGVANATLQRAASQGSAPLNQSPSKDGSDQEEP
jgi:hypothetical protein